MTLHRFKILPSVKTLATTMATIILAGSAPLALAQIGSASLTGIIEIQEKPQVGLDVIATNLNNGHSYKAITQANGSYVFKGLPPGTYRILVAGKPIPDKEKIVLRVGQAVNLDIALAQAPKEQDVDELLIVGTRVNYNLGGEIGTNISLDQIESLPQVTRNFLAFADLAPGVQFNQAQDGSTSIQGGAQSANAVNIFIDGVGQKNYVLRGGVTGQDASRGNPFPQLAIAEYKVITQNYSAEYDQVASAAIVAVTASGTNEFHGSTFYDYTDEGMREKTPAEVKAQKKTPSQQAQYGVSVGGPIIKDKLHFFFAYEGKSNNDPRDVVAGAGYNANNLPAEYRAQLGGRSASFSEDLYFGKLSYVINDEQKLELTIKERDETELTDIGGERTAAFGTDKNNDETRIALAHNWRTIDWINDFRLTYEDYSFNPIAHTRANGAELQNAAGKTILYVGGGRDFQHKSQTGWAVQEDFTYLAVSDHQLKGGLKYKEVELEAIEQQPFNPQYKYNIDYSWAQPFEVRWGAPLAGIGNGAATADNWQFGAYIQDDWSATSRLTINIGVRWDYEESDAYLDYRTPDAVVTALQGWRNLDNSNIRIADYISTGNNRDAFKDAWQPRLGFSYDIGGNHDLVIFGGLGRAYDRNLFDNLQLESTKATFPTYSANFDSLDPAHNCDPAAGNCVAWDPKYLTRAGLDDLLYANTGAGREVYLVNNKLKTPYSDQFSLGVRGTLGVWNAEFSISHVKSEDGFVWMLVNRRPDGSFFEGAAIWGIPWSYSIPGFSNGLIGTNGLASEADSVYVKLEKPKADSGWGLTAAYTYTDARENRKFDEVFALDYPSMDDYGMRDSTGVPDHRLVIAAHFDLPAGIDFAAKLNLESVKTYIGTDCRQGNSNCFYHTFKPEGDGFLGYKQLDVSFSKQIATGMVTSDSYLTVRLDILNLTNATNHGGYEDWFGGPGESLPAKFGESNGTIAGPMLTTKLGVSWNW